MKTLILLITIFTLFTFLASTAFGEVSLGADIVSRYVFRGTDFGNAPHFQPYLSYSINNFGIGALAAYPIGAPNAGSEEIDLYLSYSVPLANGEIVGTFYDYYYPTAGVEFFEFDDGEGAHTMEIELAYYGVINLLGSMVVYNDEDNSAYAEAGITREIGDVTLDMFLGASLGESANWYFTEEAALINVGLKASKEIPITDKFALPVFSSFIVNPDSEKAHVVFGMSF